MFFTIYKHGLLWGEEGLAAILIRRHVTHLRLVVKSARAHSTPRPCSHGGFSSLPGSGGWRPLPGDFPLPGTAIRQELPPRHQCARP